MLLVEGEGGIGKTRLVEEIAQEADAAGIETYVGRAEELERSRPFGALAHALRGLGPQIRDLLWGTTDHGLAGAAPSAGETRVVESLLDVIEQRAIRRPVLICVEDLHWADPATLLFLRAATRRLEGLPLAVIGTCRPSPDASDLTQLIDRVVAEGHQLLRLGPLDARDVELLVRDVVGDDPGPLLLAELERASGSPFYILEFLSALDEEGAIVVEGDRAELRQAVLPPTLRLTILRRLAALPGPTVDALRLASIVGSSFAVDDLALFERRDALDLYAVLDPAIRTGFIAERDDRLGFRHDLVRAALYEDIPAPLRKTLHRKLADAMGAAGRPITTVATHMSLGAEANDLQAAAWLMQAALVLRLRAVPVAAEFGRRAAEVAPTAIASMLDDFLAIHVFSLALTWRSAEAEALARDLLSRDLSPLSMARARHGLASALNNLGRQDEALEQLEVLVADVRLPDIARPAYLADHAMGLLGAGDLDRAVIVAREALEVSARIEHVFGTSAGHLALSLVATARGQVGEAVRHGSESTKASEVVWERREGVPISRVAYGLALMDADEADRSLEELRIGLRRATEEGVSNFVLFLRALALVQFVRGDWDDALADAAASLDPGEGERLSGQMVAYGVPAHVHLQRGELDGARAAVAAGDVALARLGDLTGADLFLWAKARLLEADGNDDAALESLLLVWSATQKLRYLFGSWRLVWPDLARLAVLKGQHDLANDVAAAAEEGARLAGGVASADGAALRIRGLAGRDPDALARASEIYESTPRPMERAMASHDAGVALVERGETERAVPLLMRAFDLYDSLGAARETDRIQAVLRGIGVRRGRTGARKRPSSGWEALTPTELRVVALVGEGLTNSRIGERLFISPRTVQTHMRSVFDKLGMVSRAEVVAEVVRRGI